MPDYDLAELNALLPPDSGRIYERGFIDGLLAAEAEHATRDYQRLLRAIDRRARSLRRQKACWWLALAATGAWLWWGR